MYFDLYFSLSYLFSSYIIYFTFWGQIQYIYISIYSKNFLIFLWVGGGGGGGGGCDCPHMPPR